MNTAFFLRTRTIQLDIFWRRYFLWFKTRGISPTLRGMTCPVVCTMPAPALCVPCLSLCDSVGTSSVRLIGKKLRKHQPRGWTCNTERSSKKCQYTSNLHERVLKPNALESPTKKYWKGYRESFLLWNEPTLFNAPNHPPVWLGVRGQEGTWFTSCYQKWPNRASRLPYLLDAFGRWDEHGQTWHHQIWPSFTIQKLSPTTCQS